MNSFRKIIDAFGASSLAAILGIDESHVRVMKARDVIPPKYWRKILEAPVPQELGQLNLSMLDDLYIAVRLDSEDSPPAETEAAE